MKISGSWAAFLTIAALAFPACALPPASPSQRLSEVAHNMSMLTRFGRTASALDFVDPSEKQAFSERRAPWEKEIRLLDVELTELRLLSKEEADIEMTVLWQRPAEADVRETQVTQHWKDGRKGWKLFSESAKSGDLSLLPSIKPLKPEAANADKKADSAQK